MEKETKILNIDVESLATNLASLGAKMVFDAVRTITYFENEKDTREPFLKLTEEGEKLKLSSQADGKEIKLSVSRKSECIQLLQTLGYSPISEVKARRISYEWDGIDFDIDEFPQIPAFLEIDLGESKYTLTDILQKLNLEDNERGEMSTPAIYKKYSADYFDLFRIS